MRDELEMSRIHTGNATKAEQQAFFNTLSCLVKSLESLYTAVDLRNESTVTGKIVSVDGYMNIEMIDVDFYNPRGKRICFDSFFINARNIRYVHMPKGKTTAELLEKQFEIMTRVKEKRAHTFKVVRAQRKQQETIKEAFAAQPSTSGT